MRKILEKIWKLLWNTLIKYGQHNCSLMAAGMSFFGLLSLIPLTLLGVSLMGYILGSSESAQEFMLKLLKENFPTSAKEILDQINHIIASPQRALINGLSLLGLMWSGMRFFHIMQGVLNRIWIGATQRPFFIGRFFAFLIFIISGLLFWFSFILTSLMIWISNLNIAFMGLKIRDFRILWFAIELITSLVSWSFMLFLVYFFVPHTKVSSKAAIIGAVFAAVFIMVSKYVFGFIMVTFNVYGRVYGSLASFIIFMSWLYLSMIILLFGAELGSQCQGVFFKNDPQEV